MISNGRVDNGQTTLGNRQGTTHGGRPLTVTAERRIERALCYGCLSHKEWDGESADPRCGMGVFERWGARLTALRIAGSVQRADC